MLKKIISIIFFSFMASNVSSAGCTYVNKGIIDKLIAGESAVDYADRDNGNAVIVQLRVAGDDYHSDYRIKRKKLETNRNLNDPMGPSILGILKEAMTKKLIVELITHRCNTADDWFDEVIVYAKE